MKSYIENGFGLSKIELKELHLPIGMCGLIKREALENVDIGFALLPAFEGQGFAREIASAMMVYGRYTLGFKKIVAVTSEHNTRSIKLLHFLGLQYTKMITLSEGEQPLLMFC